MINNQYNTYNQPPIGQMIPPQMGMPRSQGWRERWMRTFRMDRHSLNKMSELTIPDWLTGKAIAFFFLSMFACWLAFGYVPDFELWIVACISILLFFYGTATMSKSGSHQKSRQFIRAVFVVGFIIRVLWALYCYFYFNMDHYGYIYGDDADTGWYMDYAEDIALWIKGDYKGTFTELMSRNAAGFDDTGYPVWLAIGYLIWGDWSDVVIPLIIKCIVTSYCAIIIYYVAKRHFGEGVARMAALFVALNPNMIYWCGTMFKEAEMMFLVCLAVDNFDRVLSSGQKYTFRALLPGVLAGLALFFFRSALGLVMFMAVFAHVVMASQRVMSLGKKILAGILVAVVLAVSMGDRIRTQSRELMETVQSGKQDVNMEWRASRKDAGGRQQSFAKYAGAAVFAPLIFTIPFPTFNVAQEGQLLQIQLSGGSYIKNIFSFFVILVMIMLLISGEWRRHVFILAYTLGYHLVLVMSNFAQSGRFHMPVLPMLMLFAAYGIQIAKSNARVRKWFPIVLVIEVAVCLFWNWFKLKGRGMI